MFIENLTTAKICKFTKFKFNFSVENSMNQSTEIVKR